MYVLTELYPLMSTRLLAQEPPLAAPTQGTRKSTRNGPKGKNLETVPKVSFQPIHRTLRNIFCCSSPLTYLQNFERRTRRRDAQLYGESFVHSVSNNLSFRIAKSEHRDILGCSSAPSCSQVFLPSHSPIVSCSESTRLLVLYYSLFCLLL